LPFRVIRRASIQYIHTAEDTDTDTDSEATPGDEQQLPTGKTAAETLSIPPDGERPSGWTTGLYSQLKQLVRDAKGAASKPVVRFIKKQSVPLIYSPVLCSLPWFLRYGYRIDTFRSLRGTKLILVVGQTGTGKSSLIRELTGQDVVVGHTHESGS
jgi:Cdc6-like AAA superfamily ATPase